jgi:hypothetical protein
MGTGTPESAVRAIVFSRDGKRLLAGRTLDGGIQVWDAATGRQAAALTGHDFAVTTMAFSPDGTRFISGSLDRTLWVWDAVHLQPLLRLRGHDYGVESLAFSPDGQQVASISSDGTVHLWDTRSEHDPDADELVASLFQKFDLASDVMGYLRHADGIQESLRAVALRLASARGDDPPDLNSAAWSILISAQASAADYRRALRLAEAAARMNPWNADHINTLGVAQYRSGLYREALASFERSRKIRLDPLSIGDIIPVREANSEPSTEAFTAMAYFQLGERDKAWASLNAFRTLIQAPQYARDQRLVAVLREAENLIGSGNSSARADARR